MMIDDLLGCESNVFGNLPKENRRNITPGMKRYRRAPAIWMPELSVRTSLSHFDES
jgi:hypothetical protein